MADLPSLQKICDWKLLEGSHDYPGPSGGTCINEAAIVAAGLKYRSFTDYKSMPKCFSPVLAGALMSLNDALNDVDRQQLIKYVPVIAGSRDTNKVEVQRFEVLLTGFSNLLVDLFEKNYSKGYPEVRLDFNITCPYTRFAVVTRNWRWLLHPDDMYLGGSMPSDLTWFNNNDLEQLLRDGRRNTEPLFELATTVANNITKVVLTADPTRIGDLLVVIDDVRSIGKKPDELDTALIFSRMSLAKSTAKVKENAA